MKIYPIHNNRQDSPTNDPKMGTNAIKGRPRNPKNTKKRKIKHNIPTNLKNPYRDLGYK